MGEIMSDLSLSTKTDNLEISNTWIVYRELLFELNAEPHFIFDCYFKLICARPMPEV
jgi:hypothetical protein